MLINFSITFKSIAFLRKKKNEITVNSINKEWIIGKWKTDSTVATDSNFSKYQFDFQKDGNVVRSLNDSAKADTMYYEWNKASDLVWKEKPKDSTGKIYAVTKLTRDSLSFQSPDSSTVLFIKTK
ncbi:MAG: hypothetical protein IPP39_06395 [Chitinophagaceae bacterium]|nr:hypothetical protein [Chitinophagaceae bacterium]